MCDDESEVSSSTLLTEEDFDTSIFGGGARSEIEDNVGVFYGIPTINAEEAAFKIATLKAERDTVVKSATAIMGENQQLLKANVKMEKEYDKYCKGENKY